MFHCLLILTSFFLLPRVSFLIGKLGDKISVYNIGLEDVALTGEKYAGKPVYEKLVSVGSLPKSTNKTVDTGISDADDFWIDPTYSMAFNQAAAYPIPYVDPGALANSITARIINGGKQIVVMTKSDWSGYSGYVAVKYTKI